MNQYDKMQIVNNRKSISEIIVKDNETITNINFTDSATLHVSIINKEDEQVLIDKIFDYNIQTNSFFIVLEDYETSILPYSYSRSEDGFIPESTCRAILSISDELNENEKYKYINIEVRDIYVSSSGKK